MIYRNYFVTVLTINSRPEVADRMNLIIKNNSPEVYDTPTMVVLDDDHDNEALNQVMYILLFSFAIPYISLSIPSSLHMPGIHQQMIVIMIG